ncbi:serine/threonine-protein kinase [Nannocystis pusilla]|uniref:Serine/threonine protein kinase n=1 Tax=Nannocystis pusilla TaxID=889268 RepID=A0ABS7TPE7_9BACT|nr:serine/threonine protein kinase [Nannocystis pusilla]
MRDAPRDDRGLLAGRYRLDAWLGGGAMGDVYAAEDAATGGRVAIKLLNERHRERPEARERFRREAQAAARIDHPHVVKLLDFGAEPGGLPYLVMELLAGESLDCTLEREVRLPWPAVTTIAGQVAAGLQAAHDLGVVHRDLKPSNCFRTGDGEAQVIKIVDFGLAKLRGGPEGVRELTATGAWLGTLRYMAPEQAHDPASVDGRADLYSLAVIVFRLLTGAAPVQGDNELHFLNNLLHAPARALAEAAPGFAWPEALEGFFRTALARRPEERFADARSFAAALLAAAPGGVAPLPIVGAARDDEAFAPTELAAPSRREPASARAVADTCREIAAMTAIYVDARQSWDDERYPLPGGTTLVIGLGELCVAQEQAIVCPIAGVGPSPRSMAQRVCEFAGPQVAAAVMSLRARSPGHLYPLDGGRLAAGRVLFAAMASEAIGVLRMREWSEVFAANTLALVERLQIAALAVPALFWGAPGAGRRSGIVAVVEAFARVLLAAPCPGLATLRLVIPDGGEALVRAGGELSLDLSPLSPAPLERTQRFVLGRYRAMHELGAALRAAVPRELRADEYGERWSFRVVQTGRTLARAELEGGVTPAALGLKHGARLVLALP